MHSNCCSGIAQLGSISGLGASSGLSTSQAQTGLPLAGSSCQRHSRTGRRRRSAAFRRSASRTSNACPTGARTGCRRSKARTFAVLANIAHLHFPRPAAGLASVRVSVRLDAIPHLRAAGRAAPVVSMLAAALVRLLPNSCHQGVLLIWLSLIKTLKSPDRGPMAADLSIAFRRVKGILPRG